MKRKLFFILFFTLSSILFAQNQKGFVDITKMVFIHKKTGMQISFNSKIENIESKLGKADMFYDSPVTKSYKIFRWSGLEIKTFASNNQIVLININNNQYMLKDDLTIGDSLAKVVKTYGNPYLLNKTNCHYNYYGESETYWMLFRFNAKDNKIYNIELGFGD